MSKKLNYFQVHRNKKAKKLKVTAFSKMDYFEIDLYALLIKNEICYAKN